MVRHETTAPQGVVRYEWSGPTNGPPAGQDYGPLLAQILYQLQRIATVIEEDRAPSLGYRFDKITVPASQTDWEINLTPPARMLTILADNPVSVRLYERSADAIEIRGIDYPLMPPLLPASMAIRKIFVTTGVNETDVRILLFG